MNYSDKLKIDAENAINKIQIIDDAELRLKNSKKKLKSSIEEVFGRGKQRLPVFSDITVDNDTNTTTRK